MLQFDVCCKAIDQNFDCGCDRCATLRLDSLPGVVTVTKESWLSLTVVDERH